MISVESQPGHGAVFRVELPVEVAPMGVPQALTTDTPVPPVLEKAILIVDDEVGIASGLAHLLRRDGHQVDTAANGRLALEKLQEQAYDLLLCDLRMPELDGSGLYRELEHRHPYLRRRVIFLTGDTLSSETRAFLEQVGIPRLTKPFRVAEVRRVV